MGGGGPYISINKFRRRGKKLPLYWELCRSFIFVKSLWGRLHREIVTNFKFFRYEHQILTSYFIFRFIGKYL